MTESQLNKPYVSAELLKAHLNEVFNTTIDRFDSERQVWLKVGQAEVIDYLNELFDGDANVPEDT